MGFKDLTASKNVFSFEKKVYLKSVKNGTYTMLYCVQE